MSKIKLSEYLIYLKIEIDFESLILLQLRYYYYKVYSIGIKISMQIKLYSFK